MVWDAKENTLLLYAVLSPPGRYDCCVYKGRKYYPCRPWLIVACLPLYLPVIFCCSSGLHAWARVSPLDACSWSSSWCVSALRVVCGSRKNQANLPHCRMVWGDCGIACDFCRELPRSSTRHRVGVFSSHDPLCPFIKQGLASSLSRAPQQTGATPCCAT